MAKQDTFTGEEWTQLRLAPSLVAGGMVAAGPSGLISSIKESLAGAGGLAETSKTNGSLELFAALAAGLSIPGMPDPNMLLGKGSREQQMPSLKSAALERVGSAVSLVAAKASPAERRKAERAGGELRDLDTRSLKQPQLDHPTSVCTRKPLSQRWHVLGDGSGVVQHDMYSAFLPACVTAGSGKDALHSSRAQEAWPAAQSLLGRAGWMHPKGIQRCERGELARHRAVGLRPANAGTGRTAKCLSHRLGML